MIASLQCQKLFEQEKACVLLPTYNNAKTLEDVINKVLEYTSNILVVNDGSTDETAAILEKFQRLTILSYAANRGKGYALRLGIRAAAAQGYNYAISMDSDGQHYASDLAIFLHQIAITPGVLIIGARNLNIDNVPAKSSFGNRFSNFWFWVNTGNRLPDTQSGYRLYPVQALAKKRYFTTKYEFEIEVIVRAAWSGIPVTYLPISVYYPPANERISHFRPWKDFTRISILNTFLVLIAVLWIKPRDFLKLLFSKAGWKKILRSIFVNPQESNQTKAASVGFGVFMGLVPIWGFQLAIGIPLAILFRLNKVLFIMAANISVFPFTPFWWMASLVVGKWLLGYEEWNLNWQSITLSRVWEEGSAFVLGGFVLATCLSSLVYLLTLVGLKVFRKQGTGISS